MGYHGNLFGGIMLAWLDEAAAAYACQVCDPPRMVTKHIGGLTFEKPARPGQIIKIYGEVLKVGNTSITLRLEARRHSVYNGTQKAGTTLKKLRQKKPSTQKRRPKKETCGSWRNPYHL